MLLQIQEPGEGAKDADNEIAVGIDLGTTNSLVAYSKKQSVAVVGADEGRALLPSIVSYAVDGDILVGDEGAESPIRSIKRLMGRGKEDLPEIAGMPAYKLAENEHEGMVSLDIHGQERTPVEISSEILKELKQRAENELGHEVTKAVITVPAYFDDAARKATKDAARLAGLQTLRLINEPTAAALAYGLDKGAEGIYAIYDFGGGTFDVSLLKMDKGVFQVLATGGDTALGGDDFDNAIVENFLASAANDIQLSSEELNILLGKAKEIKEHLSDDEQGEWVIKLQGNDYIYKLSKQKFDRLISPYVDETIDIIRAVFSEAGLAREDVKGIVMVGGSTRVPLVRLAVEEYFGRNPLTDVDPDQVVAVGAALQAEALLHGSDTLLLDVTPLSLGLETMGNLVEKIIPRNTPIPTAQSQTFTTHKDGQSAMKVHVLQGEREMVEQCRSLAHFELRDIPPMAAGIARIEVTFSVDADGLLSVSAKEETTGVEQSVEVKPSYGLSDSQVEAMLRDSMENAREDITSRLLAESCVEAEQLLHVIETSLNEDGADLIDDAEFKSIEAQIKILREAIKSGDRDAIDSEVEALDRISGNFAEKRLNSALSDSLRGQDVDALNSALSE